MPPPSPVQSRPRRAPPAKMRFPLPDNAFPDVHVTPSQIRSYEVKIQELILKALHECERQEATGSGFFKRPWEIVGQSEGCSALRLQDPMRPNRAEYRVLGRVNGDYRHMMEFFYAETSKDLFESQQFMLLNVIDAQVLKTLQTATAENPHHYMGIKWTASQSSMFTNKVDQCFVEFMTYRKDLRGREVGVRVTLPLQLPEVDHVMDAMRVRRLVSHSVQIMRPADHTRSSTQLFLMVDNDFPSFVPVAYNKQLLHVAQNMALFVDSKRIAHHGLKGEDDWVPNSTRRSCVVCTRAFGATRGRHHCRLCGDVICRKCMLVRDTPEHSTEKIFKVVKNKFCVVCVANLRETEFSLTATSISTAKKRDIEFAPSDYDETTRNSCWSETESEGCRSGSDFSESRLSMSSLLEEHDSEKRSFAGKLQQVANRIQDPVLEELINSQGRLDIAEFIDTKDMTPEPQFRAQQRGLPSPIISDRYLEYSDRRSNPLSASSSSVRMNTPPRSLDQCLAEQEELLRRMVLATQPPVSRSRVEYEYTEYDA